MNTNDITEKQFETLVLIRAMEEFVTDGQEEFSSLNKAVWSLEESLSVSEHKDYVKEICMLTENGYIHSDATTEHIKQDIVPDIQEITLKGLNALEEYEQRAKEEMQGRDKARINIRIGSIMHLTGINVNVFNENGGLFKFIAQKIKERLWKAEIFILQ